MLNSFWINFALLIFRNTHVSCIAREVGCEGEGSGKFMIYYHIMYWVPFIKGTVSELLSDHACKDSNAQFKPVSTATKP